MIKKEHIAILEKTHTRVILQWRERAYKCSGGYNSYLGADDDEIGYSPYMDGYGPRITIEEMKHVLKTREHVPNKRQAKVIRQNKAKGLM